MTEPRPERQFPTTSWSIVVRLKSSEAKVAEDAVKEVFNTYRYPLYGYLRASGVQHEDAEDVLQGFFEKMLRNDGLMRADRARGKLRTFLLTSISRYKLNWQRGEQRRHRRVQAEADLWEADEARFQNEQHAANETPETYYDRRWAMELIERVRQHLRTDCRKRGKEALHDALAPLLSSTLPETESFAAIASRLGMAAGTLRVALSRLRSDFRDFLLHEVQRTLDEGEDARAEIRHLISLFGG